jgi:hypothetical protein
VKRDKDRQAETEHKDGDEEVAVTENGFRAFGFVHGCSSGPLLMIDEGCAVNIPILPAQLSDPDVVATTGRPDEDSRRYDTE